MRRDHARGAGPRRVTHHLEHARGPPRVLVGGRLVGHEHPGGERERPGERGALLFPERGLFGVAAPERRQAEPVDQVLDELGRVGEAPREPCRVSHVLLHGKLIHQPEPLRHDGEVGPRGRRPAGNFDGPLVRPLPAGHEIDSVVCPSPTGRRRPLPRRARA